MKKKILSMLMVFTLAIGTLTSVPAAPQAAAAEGVTYQKKTVTAHLFNMEKAKTIDILIPSNLPEVPYINAEDYFDAIYVTDFTLKSVGSGIYEIKGVADSTMTVDVNKDTMTFDSIARFLRSPQNIVNQDGVTDTEGFPCDSPEELQKDYPKSVTLNMSDYKIDLVEQDGKVYLPLPTLNDLTMVTYNGAEYYGGDVYFVHGKDYQAAMLGGAPVYFAAEQAKLYDKVENSEAFAAFNYNEFCFCIDHMYGRPAQAKVAADIAAKGFDKTLDELDKEVPGLKKAMQSTNRVDNNIAMQVLMNYFFDGGHTGFGQSLAFHTGSPVVSEFYTKVKNHGTDPLLQAALSGIMTGTVVQTRNAGLAQARAEAFQKYTILAEWNGGVEAILAGAGGQVLMANDNIAVFSFDSIFNKDCVLAFKEALDIAKDNGIKQFVVDLGNNGGGLVVAADFILGIMNNSRNNAKSNRYSNWIKDITSGSLTEQVYRLDLNLDGEINDADKEVRYDFDFAILTSAASFSTANFLPCIASQIGIPIIGEKSSGGSCELTFQHMADYTLGNLSGPFVMMYTGGEKDVDGGAPVDVELLKTDAEGTKDYSDFYNLDVLSSAVDKATSKASGMTVKAKAQTVKAGKLKKADVRIKNAIKVKGNAGKVTYAQASRSSKKISINKKGVIIIKKGNYKKGSVLKIKVTVSDAGNSDSATNTATVTVKVKIK